MVMAMVPLVARGQGHELGGGGLQGRRRLAHARLEVEVCRRRRAAVRPLDGGTVALGWTLGPSLALTWRTVALAQTLDGDTVARLGDEHLQARRRAAPP